MYPQYGASTEEESSDRLQSARPIYAAFGRGGVAAAFFSALAGIDVHPFELKSLLAAGPAGPAVVDIAFTVEATGKRVVVEDGVHRWHFGADGLVQRFRRRAGTHAHRLACGP